MSVQRAKLFHAIIFFTKKTRDCHKLKLFKLLYFLDFEVYRQTGKSATGLRYFAWKNGPVPAQLQSEFKRPPADMSAALVAHTAAADDPDADSRLTIVPRVPFDESRFTARELAVMAWLAEVFFEAAGKHMILATHEIGLPWHQVYEVEGKHQAQIPYELVLKGDRPGSISREQADQMALEARGVAALCK